MKIEAKEQRPEAKKRVIFFSLLFLHFLGNQKCNELEKSEKLGGLTELPVGEANWGHLKEATSSSFRGKNGGKTKINDEMGCGEREKSSEEISAVDGQD